ncbi:ParB N-terminal domain-containing protein [Treponema phagedenis]|uniref:ParB N-terminal domain-containing protein n=1 Tax=Treponema phagedenis TaxID=162 RepID=UPI0015A1239D|nr:ParB N-terminal domain-containing protein [Treponema phagedenis]NVP23248.1 ParB N-terminal domain-containing protein [Treponema phagedenis]QLC58109.1 ParB N-terminal domain-containing protein [Treponema phagedenis]
MENKNKLERFTIQTIKRSQIQEADYNPRTINSEAKKKLKRGLKTYGMVQPIVVNSQTMNVVGGHQRLAIMDEEYKYPKTDYTLQVAMINVSLEEEVKINVFLNNPAAQGEWDAEMLQEIKLSFPDIDFQKDLAFDMLDMQHLFAGTELFESASSLFEPTQEQSDIVDMAELAKKTDRLKEARQKERDLRKAENRSDTDYQAKNDDYVVSFVFENNAAKQDFCRRANIPISERFVKSALLYDIADGRIKMRGGR